MKTRKKIVPLRHEFMPLEHPGIQSGVLGRRTGHSDGSDVAGRRARLVFQPGSSGNSLMNQCPVPRSSSKSIANTIDVSRVSDQLRQHGTGFVQNVRGQFSFPACGGGHFCRFIPALCFCCSAKGNNNKTKRTQWIQVQAKKKKRNSLRDAG